MESRSHPTGPDRSRRGTRLRVRTLLGLVIAIPVLATAAISTTVVRDRWDDRQASVALTRSTESFDRAVALRAAITAEGIHSVVLTLAPLLGNDLAAVGTLEVTRMELGIARHAVDDAIRAAPRLLDEADVEGLQRVREEIDRGEVAWADIDPVFQRIQERLSSAWRDRLARIESRADERALSAALRARLRAVREAAAAFEAGSLLMRETAAVHGVTESVSESLLSVVEADAALTSAIARLRPDLGVGAQRAWHRLAVDPAARRAEAFFELTRSLVTSDDPSLDGLDSDVLSRVADSQRWGVLLIDVIRAASDDLKAAAEVDSDHAEEATVRWAVVAAGVLLASLVLGSVFSRVLAHPTVSLGRAARRVAEGEFDLPPVPVRGPREIADSVRAFNEMAATLSAVEDHAVALAEDPDSPVLDQQLPGRTGRAMQRALDALRSSIELAEEQRVRLAELATTDDLTGLRNRKGTMDAVEQAMARDRREGRRTVALFVDMDGLKHLNDAHGHATGDAAIRAVADALRGSTRTADVVGRIGGDEFLVVGPEPPGGRRAVEAMAERILGAVRAARVDLPGGDRIGLRCSVGVALADPVADTGEALVRRADAGLYVAKRGGRDRLAWDDEVDSPAL